MLTTIGGSTATTLFRQACSVLVKHETIRGRAKMMEAPGPTAFTLTDPRQNIVLVPERQLNPWVTMAEFPWLICGRNDIKWLRTYLPRAEDFSDDGKVWRAGYGPRMRKWYAPGRPHDEADQLQYARDELRPPCTSRRAVISLWDPRTDHKGGSKDYPCTDLLIFQIRGGGTLDLSVTMRSNDLVWGWSGVNVFNFTTLQRAMAEWTGLKLGTYYHFADNLHVYERHFEMARAVADGRPVPVAEADATETFGGELRVFEGAAGRLMAAIDDGRTWFTPEAVPAEHGGTWLQDWAYFMSLHPLRDEPGELADRLAAFGERREDWRWAAMAWANRHEDAVR